MVFKKILVFLHFHGIFILLCCLATHRQKQNKNDKMIKILIPSYKHLAHCLLMVTWIIFFVKSAQDHQEEAPKDIFDAYGSVKGIILLCIRLISLLAFPQTLLNFVSLCGYETFPDKVRLRYPLENVPLFIVRVVTRGLYPNLVEKNVKRNLETIYSVGCENFLIEGKSIFDSFP